MADTRRAGFTVLEMMIVVALASLLVALLYTPMVNGLIMVNRENTLMNMFRTGDTAMSRLASILQPAVLPMPTNASGVNNNNSGTTTKPYQRVINSERGFWTNGRAWRNTLLEGTDFLPFCVPTMYKETGSAVDTTGLPVLGITMPNGNREISATYREITTDDDKFLFDLNNRNIHPALAALNPSAFGLDVNTRPDTVAITHARYSERLAFPANSNTGYGVIRFVPELVDGQPVVLNEATLNYDLNQNGTQTDTFARGRLVVTYANDGTDTNIRNVQTEFPLGNQSILLQLNTAAPGYVPMFRLVGGFTGNNSPSGTKWNEANLPSGNTYVLLVRLLLFDSITQQGTVMATGRQDGRQFITRQFQTFIEMRNMSLE